MCIWVAFLFFVLYFALFIRIQKFIRLDDNLSLVTCPLHHLCDDDSLTVLIRKADWEGRHLIPDLGNLILVKLLRLHLLIQLLNISKCRLLLLRPLNSILLHINPIKFLELLLCQFILGVRNQIPQPVVFLLPSNRSQIHCIPIAVFVRLRAT